MNRNKRETGVRKPETSNQSAETDTDAALPAKPEPYGLTESTDETEEKARHSEGVDQSAAVQKKAGAAAAARHSKDAVDGKEPGRERMP